MQVLPPLVAATAGPRKKHLDELFTDVANKRKERLARATHLSNTDRVEYIDRFSGWCANLPTKFQFKLADFCLADDKTSNEEDSDAEQEDTPPDEEEEDAQPDKENGEHESDDPGEIDSQIIVSTQSQMDSQTRADAHDETGANADAPLEAEIEAV